MLRVYECSSPSKAPHSHGVEAFSFKEKHESRQTDYGLKPRFLGICVHLEQFSNFSVPEFSHLKNRNDMSHSHFKDKKLDPREVECFA